MMSPRPAHVILLIFLMMVGIPVASAEYIEIPVTDISYISKNYNVNGTPSLTYPAPPIPVSGIEVNSATSLSDLPTLIMWGEFKTNNMTKFSNSIPVRLTKYNTDKVNRGTGILSYHLYPPERDGFRQGYVVLEITSFTPVVNEYKFDIYDAEKNLKAYVIADNLEVNEVRRLEPNEDFPLGFCLTSGIFFGQYTMNVEHTFSNLITVYGPDDPSETEPDNITVLKSDGDHISPSRVIIWNKFGTYLDESIPTYNDVSASISSLDRPYNIDIYDPLIGRWHNQTVFDIPDPDDPGDHTLTVYIKNSQTGALIANANVVIDALVDGEYYPVVNRTEPSGIFTINLQPTGGGKPNPDGYRLIVTADGYNNPMPEINFTVDDYKNYIYCLLDPIAGGPVNEDKTFIDFFVRDMSSNPISGATVKFGKYTLITNSAGYTVFEVDKNNNYSWTVSKSGYGPLTGNAVIGDSPRHTINTVLAPIVTPTITTPIPTSPPIGPTPTMTAPTGEHVSNWLEWFAAHFGMILGGGVEIGKIFMWLCFTVPVGVYVGKEAKAGAAGFMAGAGIVTLFFVLIGWVPIWLVVLLALIIGLLYAKVFNSQDNGGGR
jgi:hypothetical protein